MAAAVSQSQKKILIAASVASMIDQFNMQNICLLQQMGYKVYVACNFKEGNTCDDQRILAMKKKLREMHVVWYQWDCQRRISFTSGIQKCRTAYRQILEIMSIGHYEWVHCHSPIGGALARAAAHRCGIRSVYTAHGFHFYKGAPLKNWLLYYPVEKLLAHWTHSLITVNKEDALLARRWLHAKKVWHIPGVGIDTGCFAMPQAGEKKKPVLKKELCRKYKVPKNALVLLSVGELSRRKNHQVVIRVLPKLSNQNIYYLICGQGAMHSRLKRQAERLGIADRVRLLGFMEGVADYYQAADIFVFPSLQEGLPVALLEAMAAGLPCAVSDIRGNRELISCQGMRFAPKNNRQLQEILEQMAVDEQYRQKIGHCNQQKVQQYDLAVVTNKMRKIYEYMNLH